MPRAVDRAERIAAITAAVEGVATTEGFSAVTVRRVSEQLGASTTMVTHYFPSRAELVRFTVRQVIDRRTNELEHELHGLQGRFAVRAMADWVALRPSARHHRLWLAIVVGAAADDVLREELDRFNGWWDDRVSRHIADFEPPEADPHVLADLLDVVLSGLVVAGLETESVWEQRRRQMVLDRLLGPLGLPSGP